jgi:chloramphenicol-sensitive protein RarD
MTEQATSVAPTRPNEDSRSGLAFALLAYFLWGFLPLYMKALAHIPPPEVIAHRILWSIPIAGTVLIVLKRTSALRAALASPRMVAQAALTATVISVNWGIYVWAIGAGRALDTALGYYINPLFSVFLGAVLLGERLTRAQLVAIGLAVIAVAVLTWEAGNLPWVALALTFSWGAYAYFRKTLPIGPNQGFFLEILLLSPIALAYVIYLELTGTGHLLAASGLDTALLIGCGAVTAVPLMLYANGAKLLRLSTIGMLQYIAPTMIFLIAVFVFDEPFSTTKLVAFTLIWAALALFTTSMLSSAQRSHAGKD